MDDPFIYFHSGSGPSGNVVKKRLAGYIYIYILYIINESSLKKLQNATAFVITKPSNFNMSCNIFFHLVALNILKEFPQVPICI